MRGSAARVPARMKERRSRITCEGYLVEKGGPAFFLSLNEVKEFFRFGPSGLALGCGLELDIEWGGAFAVVGRALAPSFGLADPERGRGRRADVGHGGGGQFGDGAPFCALS